MLPGERQGNTRKDIAAFCQERVGVTGAAVPRQPLLPHAKRITMRRNAVWQERCEVNSGMYLPVDGT